MGILEELTEEQWENLTPAERVYAMLGFMPAESKEELLESPQAD